MPQYKHIDNQKLFTDLMYRFQFVSEFMGFDEQDIKTIKSCAGAVAPLVPTVVDAVYSKLFKYDVTRVYFTQRNQGFSGKLDNVDSLGHDSEQIKFRKDMLSKYLVKLVTAEYDEDFIRYLDWTAKIHTKHEGRGKSLDVQYVYINALMGYVNDILLKAICELGLDQDTQKQVVRAFTKLLWVQNDFFALHYVKETDDHSQQVRNESVSVKSWLPVAGIAGAIGVLVGLALGKNAVQQ